MPLRWKMKEMSLDFTRVEKVLSVPEMAPLSLAFSPQTNDKIVARYRNALIAIKENGIYGQILNKWRLPEDHKPAHSPAKAKQSSTAAQLSATTVEQNKQPSQTRE